MARGGGDLGVAIIYLNASSGEYLSEVGQSWRVDKHTPMTFDLWRDKITNSHPFSLLVGMLW